MGRDDITQREEQRRRATLPVAVLVLAGLLIPPQARPASLADLVGIAHLDTWEAPEGREVKTIRGLTLVEWLPDREVTLILLELEGERRLVLSREHRALEGVSVLRLLDDDTGWWVRLTDRSTLKIDDIDHLGNIAMWMEAYFEVDHVVSSILRTKGGEELTWTSPFDDTGRRADFFEQVDTEGVTAELVEGMPEGLDSALRELASLLAGDHGSGSLDAFEPLVELVVATLDRRGEEGGERYEGLSWKLTERSGQTLREPLSAASREFAGRFGRVPAEDPLAQFRDPEERLRGSGHAPQEGQVGAP